MRRFSLYTLRCYFPFCCKGSPFLRFFVLVFVLFYSSFSFTDRTNGTRRVKTRFVIRHRSLGDDPICIRSVKNKMTFLVLFIFLLFFLTPFFFSFFSDSAHFNNRQENAQKFGWQEKWVRPSFSRTLPSYQS